MKNIKITDKLISLLLSGVLAFTLVGCKNKKNEYIPFDEIFYDSNVEGIDDALESRISDSNEQIQNIITLEKVIDLIPRLMEIDYTGATEDYSIPYLMENSENISLEDLNQIEELLNEYQELTEDSNFITKMTIATQTTEIRKELYKDLLLLLNYVEYRGNTILYQFGNRLYDSIILDTGEYPGNERNAYSLVGTRQGSYAVYDNDEVRDTIRINNGQFYNLVAETGRYQDYAKLPVNYELHISYAKGDKKSILERIEQYRKTIDLYKESMVTYYEINERKKSFFDFLDESIPCDKEIACGESDTTRILKK